MPGQTFKLLRYRSPLLGVGNGMKPFVVLLLVTATPAMPGEAVVNAVGYPVFPMKRAQGTVVPNV